jgi:hypothetical protein
MKMQEILDHEIIGNAMSDMPLMDAIHDFVVDETNSVEDRCRVLYKLDEVMGLAGEMPTEAELNEYLSWSEE